MENLLEGFAVLSRMLGVEASVLRAVAAPWAGNPQHAPITPEQFLARLAQVQKLAGQLNNTNAWEQAITRSLSPDEIPSTLPTSGVQRSASEAKAMLIYGEIMDRFIVAMDPTNTTRATPHSVFRFGAMFADSPTVEVYQPLGSRGSISMAGTTEDAVRLALTGVGFIEAKRYDPEGGNVTLEHISAVFAKGK